MKRTFSTLSALMVIVLFLVAPANALSAAAHPNFLPAPTTIITTTPASPLLGSDFNINLSFQNTGDQTGYGPYADLFLPTSGTDGTLAGGPNDGISFNSAAFVGQPLVPTQLDCPAGTTITHPLTNLPIICPAAPAGYIGPAPFHWQLNVFQLPFGSFTVGQSSAKITVSAHLSNFANISNALPLYTEGGFIYGNVATGSTPIVGAQTNITVPPSLFTFKKTYLGPEDETATGPNFPRQYKLAIYLASGQKFTNVQIADLLPNNMAFLSVDPATSPAGFTVSTSPTVGVAANSPNNKLLVTFPGTITGSGSLTVPDVFVIYNFFIPQFDANVAPILDPTTGGFVPSVDNASATASWTPLDPRDSPAPVSAIDTHTLTDKSIAIQKGVVDLTHPGAPIPGDVVEYTLDTQVSDFFAVQNLITTDVLSDGQRFDAGFTPTMQVNGNTYVLPAAGMNGANYTVAPFSGVNGTQTITFRDSAEQILRGQPNGKFIGGCVPITGTVAVDCAAHNDGPTNVVIKFRAIIQNTFDVTFPNKPVSQGDKLDNAVTATADLLKTSDASTPTGSTRSDTSGATIVIIRGSLFKTLYQINGTAPVGNPPAVAAGDVVTYRLQYSLPTNNFTNLKIEDFLPLPIFDATTVSTTFVPGPNNTYAGPNPTITTNGVKNSVTFDYGTYNGSTGASNIDILLNVTAKGDPFVDGLFLTNQATSTEGSNNTDTQTVDQIIQVQIVQPVIDVAMGFVKGVIATDNPAGVFAPSVVGPAALVPSVTGCPTISSPITTAALTANPVNSDLSKVDAGDLVRFAIVIDNSGRSGGYNIQFKDTLPAGFVAPASGIALCVIDGSGATINTTDLGGGLFVNGLQLTDPGPTNGPPASLDGALDPGKNQDGTPITNGHNIAIITYTLKVATPSDPSPAQASQVITNTATLTNYAGQAGGKNFVPAGGVSDNAKVTIAAPSDTKTLISTNIVNVNNDNTHAVIGEQATYTVTITVPEGITPNAQLIDTLPPGLAFVNLVSSALSPGVSIVGSTTPTITNNGQTVTFALGDVTNSDTNNAVPETITLTYNTVVLNVASNKAGTTLTNAAAFTYGAGLSIPTATAPPITVIEPKVNTAKTVASATGQAGDPVTYTITLTGSQTDAYDATLSDPIPVSIANPTLTSVVATGTEPAIGVSGLATTGNFTITGSTLSSTPFDVPSGGTVTLTITGTLAYTVTPGLVITNTATTLFTSLPGSPGVISTYNPNSTERTGADGVGGALNNYASKGSVIITVINPQAAKTLVTTSVIGTNNDATHAVIGETATYQVVLTIPKGITPNASLVDSLPPGLALFTVDSVVSSSAALTTDIAGGFPAVVTATNTNTTPPGQTLTFNLGNLTNADVSANPIETITIVYRAIVLNVLSNQAGTTLTNSAVFKYNGTALAPVAAPPVTLIKPDVPVTKTVNPSAGQAGDLVTYTVELKNAPGTPDAFNVQLSDPLPTTDIGGLAITGVTGTGSCTTAGNFTISAGVLQTVAPFDMLAASVCDIVITLTGNINPSVAPGQVIVNTATDTFYSLPSAAPTTPLSPYNPNSTVRTGADGPGAGLNNYSDKDTRNITIFAVAPVKSIVSTSEPSTTTPKVAIGEIVRYRMVVQIPRSTSPNFQLVDNIAAGMQYLNDNTTKVALVAHTGTNIISSTLGTSASVSSDTVASVTPTFVLPGASISGGTAPGVPPVFSLGNITNGETNAGTMEYVVIEFNALVSNIAPNVDATPLTDTFQVKVSGANSGPASNSQSVTVAEPKINTLTKIVDKPTGDAGDPLVYTLTFTNTGSASAFDAVLTDTLDANVSYTAGSATAVITGGGPCGTTASTATVTNVGNAITVNVTCLLPTAKVTVTIPATIVNGVLAGAVIPNNTSNVKYTSLPGTGTTNTTDNPTGSTTPGGSGTINGERDGSGGVNNYNTNGNPVTTNVPGPTIIKLVPDNTTPTIGDLVTYDIRVTLPEGVTKAVSVTDAIPVGMTLVGAPSIIKTLLTSNGHLTADYNGTLPAPTQSGNVKLTFGDITTAPDNVVNNNSFLVRVVTQVTNIVGNVKGKALINTASLTYIKNGTVTTVPTSSQTVTVTEPKLTPTKTVSPTANVQGGDTLTYTVTLKNNGNSTAYGVVLTDTLAQGVTFVSVTSGNCTLSAPIVNEPVTASVAAGVLTITGSGAAKSTLSIPVGRTLTCIYTATANNPGLILGGAHTNTVSPAYNSQDQNGPNASKGRPYNGPTTTATFTTLAPTIAKSVDQPLRKIGQTATYTLTITSPLGTLHNLTITDTLPIGLQFVVGSSAFTNITPSPITPTFTGANDGTTTTALTWNFGDAVVTPSPATISYQVTVVDIPANHTSHALINSAVLSYTGSGGVVNTLPPVTATITITPNPVIGLAKQIVAGTVVNNGDGTYNVPYVLLVKNYGNVTLNNVQVADDLNATYTGAAAFSIQTAPTVNSPTLGASLTPNAAYTGIGGGTNLLTGGTLPVGGSEQITFTVRVTPGSKLGVYNNSALASGVGTDPSNVGTTTVTDQSQDGPVPDPGNDGNPAIHNVPTPVSFTENPLISAAKSAGTPTLVTPGIYDVPFTVTLTNTGDTLLNGVQVTDDLTRTFPTPAIFTVQPGIAASVTNGTGSGIAPDSGFTGNTGFTNLLAAGGSLNVNGVVTITFTVRVRLNGTGPAFTNNVLGSGTSPGGIKVTSPATAPVTINNPVISVTKTIGAGPVVNNGDGTYDVPYIVTVNNPGNVPLTNVQVADDLSTAFPSPGSAVALSQPSIQNATGGALLTAVTTYTGSGANTGLLVPGSSSLPVGASAEIHFTVRVTPATNLGPYTNTAVGTATGNGPSGPITVTASGSIPVTFTEAPLIKTTKAAGAPTFAGPGADVYDVPFTVTVSNTGNVVLHNVQVTDDLTNAFPPAATFTIQTLPAVSGAGTGFTGNATFDGSTDKKLVTAPGGILTVGSTETITYTVRVTLNGRFTPFTNTVVAVGTSPAGTIVTANSSVPVIIDTATPTNTTTVTPSATNTATPTASLTDTLTPTLTPTSTASLTDTLTPTLTPTSTASLTDTLTPTFTPTSTASLTTTLTPTGSPTVTLTYTPSVTASLSSTPSATSTASGTSIASATSSLSPTVSATVTPTLPTTATVTATITNTPNGTPSATNTATGTLATSTASPTSTVTGTLPTVTPSATSTVTGTLPTVTPSATSTVTGTPPTATPIAPTATAFVIVIDPAISKIGDPTLAQPGEAVTFTLTVTNNGNSPAPNVIVTDPVPSIFNVLSATSTQGTFVISGNLVTFTVGTVTPGQVITLRVLTRVRSDVVPPVIVTNIATLHSNGNDINTSNNTSVATTRITKGVLPGTGEHPDDRPVSPLPWLAGAVLLIGVSAYAWRRRRVS